MGTTTTQITTDEAELARAFTEWERRARREPQRDSNEASWREQEPATFGAACASYLVDILKDLRD